MKPLHRRKFIKQTGIIALASLTVPNSAFSFTNNEEKKIKVGLIGVGLRGQNHLELLLRRNDVIVTAIADPDNRMLAMANKLITKTQRCCCNSYCRS